MLSVGIFELLLILAIILIIFGPEQLPNAIKIFVKVLSRFKKANEEMRLIFMGLKEPSNLQSNSDQTVIDSKESSSIIPNVSLKLKENNIKFSDLDG